MMNEAILGSSSMRRRRMRHPYQSAEVKYRRDGSYMSIKTGAWPES